MSPKSVGSKAASIAAGVHYGSPEAFATWTEALLNLEKVAEEEETTDLLMSCTHTELQARGLALLKLCVASQSTALYGRASLVLEKAGGAPLPAHRMTSGDIVGLFDQHLRPLSKAVPLTTAVVQRVRPNGLTLVFDGDIPNEVLDGRPLNVASVASDVTNKRYREVLDTLKSGKVDGSAASLVDVCFGDARRPHFRDRKSESCGRADAVDCEFLAEQSRRLNEPQQAAVVKALCASELVVIHGPPGTGKTTTLVAYICEAAYRRQRLLVTAPSNVAVDNLLERVVDSGLKSVVRLGHPARIQSQCHEYSLDSVVYASDQAGLCRDVKKELDDALKRNAACRGGNAKAKKEGYTSGAELTALRKELRDRERRAVSEVLRKRQVVFATCAGAATLHKELKRAGRNAGAAGEFEEFDVVVIDEAAQALEVSCWIPMLLGKKAVLAGDHQQLSACVKSQEAQHSGLDHTLFARTIERYGDDVAALLSIQYRMNSVIMGWSSSRFYSDRLTAAESVADRTLQLVEAPSANIVGELLEAMRAPLLFVDTGGLALYREEGASEAVETHRAGGGQLDISNAHQSRGNPGEARFLAHYAKMLVKCGVQPKDITVITPYNRQVESLRNEFVQDEECGRLGLEKPRVNTVDSFQGQEADAVLISLVRSNERGVVGFLSDYRRLNVAVTRARKHVMLVGDAATITADDTLASLYDYACEHGKVLFVQQLLDENGGVPPDLSAAATMGARNAASVRKLEKGQEKRQEKVREEEQLRQQFESRLRPLLEEGSKGHIVFKSKLNPYERAIAHEVAASLGLLHESRGEGTARRLVVWSPGTEPPAFEVPKADDAVGGRKVDLRQACASQTDDPGSDRLAADAKSADAEDEVEGETALEAFERRAATLIGSLSAAQPSAEWKNPSDVEVDIITRLVEAASEELECEIVGSGKKRRCCVRLLADDLSTSCAAAGYPSAVEPPVARSGATCSASSSSAVATPNAALAELQKARLQRQQQAKATEAAEAEARLKENEAAKADLKVAKKANKKKLQDLSKTDKDDDLDALLEEFETKDCICHFGPCNERINTLMDMISKCKFCNFRFCLTHAQAERHGCGDAAQRSEQKKFKDDADAYYSTRGNVVVKKPITDRSAVANKLQDKLKECQDGRTAKPKDKKK